MKRESRLGQRHVTEKGTQCAQPVIAGPNAVGPLGLQMFEEPPQESNVNVFKTQLRRRSPQGRGGILEHHPEGIAICRNGVRACAELGDQAISEESLNERGHP